MNLRPEEIKLMASGLAPGEQRSGMLCPVCNGGAERDHSFSIHRLDSGAVNYKCHRAKCLTAGHILPSVGMADSSAIPSNVPNLAKRFYTPLEGLPAKVVAQMGERYALSPLDLQRGGFLWAPQMDGGRIAMPIRSRWGKEIGHSFRSLSKKVKPKNRIYLTDTDKPGLAYYVSPLEENGSFYKPKLPVVLVEDQISALRISQYVNAVSLLGTNLSAAKVLDLAEMKAEHVMIALDEDATHLAAKYVCQYDAFFPKLSMIQLKYDLKDIADEAIKEALFV